MMAGNIRKTPAGKWQIRVSAGVDPVTGKRAVITETVKGSHRSAELRMAELVNKSTRQTTSTLSLRQAIEEFLALPRLADSTVTRKYRPALKHLPAKVAATRADRLNGQILDALYDKLLDDGVGAPTIVTLHGLISAACAQEMKWGKLAHNPAALATPPTQAESKAKAPVMADLDKLIDVCKDNELNALWLRLHMVTGARMSELIALRWSRIDLTKSMLTIDVAANYDRTLKDPKTRRGFRSFTVDEVTMGMIRSWQKAQRIRALEHGAGLAADPFLLSHAENSGRPWRPNGVSQLFQRQCARAKVEGVRLHDLRHAAASFMIADGLDVTTIAYRLGQDPLTTQRIYAHMLKDRDKHAADSIAARFDVAKA